MSLEFELREPTQEDLKKAQVLGTVEDNDPPIVPKPIPQEESDKILGLVPALPDGDALKKNFFKREGSLAAPRKGATIKKEFPPNEPVLPPPHVEEQKEATRKELKILRFMPTGELTTVAHILITFNQPIISLASIDDIQDIMKDIPISIFPNVEGEWRWMGTQTVKFKPKYRFPKSTKYTVKVGKELTSEWGVKFGKDFEYNFELPSLTLQSFFPTWDGGWSYTPELHKIDVDNPIFYVQFDQKVDPTEILKMTEIKNVNPENIELITVETVGKLLEENGEMKKKRPRLFARYNYFLKNGIRGHFFWFRVVKKTLDFNAIFDVTFKKGLPSLEGPKVTEEKFTEKFQTYGDFKVVAHSPDREKYGGCPPKCNFTISFSNNIELDSFVAEEVFVVEPMLKNAKFTAQGNYVSVVGISEARMKYTIAVKAEKIFDIFGQRMEKDVILEFFVGACAQSLQTFRNGRTVVKDPMTKNSTVFPYVSVRVSKVHVIVYQITPRELSILPFKHLFSTIVGYDNNKGLKNLDDYMIVGKKVFDDVVEVNAPHEDAVHEGGFDFGKYLQFPDEKKGIVVVLMEPAKGSWGGKWRDRPILKQCIQCTELAVDAVCALDNEVYAWASDLRTGKFVEDAKFELIRFPIYVESVVKRKKRFIEKLVDDIPWENGRLEFQVDEKGIATMPDKKKEVDDFLGLHNQFIHVVCRKGNDVCVLPELKMLPRPTERQLWYVFDDRGLYKPKEKVHVKGIIRRLSFPNGKVKLGYPRIGQSTRKLKVNVQDARGNIFVKNLTVEVSSVGSFSFDFPLPDNVNTGNASINLEDMTIREHHYHSFRIDEFRTPKFTSKLTVPNKSYYIVDDAGEGKASLAVATVKASYYSGGGLVSSETRWTVTQSEMSQYSPPRFSLSRFSFCTSTNDRRIQRGGQDEGNLNEKLSKYFNEGKTDVNGESQVSIDWKPNPDRLAETLKCPTRMSVTCNVQDLDRQTISSESSFVVHPSELYVGLKATKSYGNVGDRLPLQCVVVDVDGIVVEGVNVVVTIKKRSTEYENYQWVTKEEKLAHAKIEFKSAIEHVDVDIKVKEGGQYIVYAGVIDSEGRENYSSVSLWVQGESLKSGKKSFSASKRDTIKLIANEEEYKPGEEAKVLLTSPLKGEQSGVAFVFACGVRSIHHFSIPAETTSYVLKIPISADFVPNCLLKVCCAGLKERIDSSGDVSKENPLCPGHAEGSLTIKVPPTTFDLNVEVTPGKNILTPGEKSHVDVVVKDSNGNTVKDSLVTMVIVDDAVLSLTSHKCNNPLNTFYDQMSFSGNGCYYIRDKMFDKDWSELYFYREHKRGFLDFAEDALCAIGGLVGGLLGKRRKCCYTKCAPTCNQNSTFGLECSRCCDCAPSSGCFGGCVSCGKKSGGKRSRSCLGECSEKDKCCNFMSGEKENDDFGGEIDEDSRGGKEMKEEDLPKSVSVRKAFKPLVAFICDKMTDNEGKVRMPFDLPDNLTNFRIWTIVHKDEKFFGLGESSVKVQLPISVRPSLPRFLNFGDRAKFSVVVVNQTESEMTIKVASRAQNIRYAEGGSCGYKAVVPSGKRTEMQFFIETESCGTGRFQVVAVVPGTEFSDSVIKELPIYTPCTSEAFATYGVLDTEKEIFVQPVLPPKIPVFAEFGGLEVSFSSTALQSLTDSFLYVYSYKEQISSRILSIVSLKDFLSAFNVPKMPKKKEIDDVIIWCVKKLENAQKIDGSFGFWSLLSASNIYLSIQIALTLIRMVENGLKDIIPQTLLNRSRSFIQNAHDYMPFWYSKSTKANLRSMALYVLTLFLINGVIDESEKGDLQKRAENTFKTYEKELNLEGKAWILFCLYYTSKEKKNHSICKKILSEFSNCVNETPETANFITDYGDDGVLVMLHSNRRTDAIILEVLCHVDPKESNGLIVKVVKGLLKGRKKGRWSSTQECVYILMALKKYFDTFENEVPDFNTKMWIDSEYGGEVKFKGREINYKQVEIPMEEIMKKKEGIEGDKKEFIMLKEGKGRCYYRLGMSYAPKNFDLKPIDYGFIVHRTYEAVKDKDDVEFDTERGCWVFKAGELIRVKLKLINCAVRYHVALVDYLPGGCEVLNPGTPVVPSPKEEDSGNYWWRRTWYEHQNLRDERVEAFCSYLYCGEHSYSYTMRATSHGEFVVPPTKAEEMYSPEVFGRSKSEKVLVVPKEKASKKEDVVIEIEEKN